MVNETMKCRICGKENSTSAAYCFNCGASIGSMQDNPPEFKNGGSGHPVATAALQPARASEGLRTPTGIVGLDAMINGGIPRGRVVLIAGGPGTGKTTMSMQYLVNGCVKYGENGIFVSLDESLNKILEDTVAFGWNLSELIQQNKITFIETPTLNDAKFSVEELLATIKTAAQSSNAKRIALDPLTYISIHYPDIVARRRALMNLFNTLADTGATCMVTNEMRGEGERAILLEEYLADGVFRLQSSQIERGRVRTIGIEKMRGTVMDDQIRGYVIEKNGINVTSESDVFTYAARLFAKGITMERASQK
jgi:circadian clock protein KaiC